MSEKPERSGRNLLISLSLFLVVAFGFFSFVGDYVLSFQEQQSLFLLSGDCLREGFSKPGGPLTYLAGFLVQFYASPFLGALLVSVILSLPAVVLFSLKKRAFPGIPLPWPIFLVPSLLLFGLQTNHYHGMEHNLGVLLVLLYYLLAVSAQKPYQRVLVLLLIPVFYFLAGAYALVFSALYLCHLLLEEGSHRYVQVSLLVTLTVASFLAFWKVLFLEPFKQILLSPLPLLENPPYSAGLFLLITFIFLLPFIRVIPRRAFAPWTESRVFSLASVISAVALSGWVAYKQYDVEVARVVDLQRFVFAEEWDRAIEAQEDTPSRALIGQFLYNTALSETDQLLDRLFLGPQDYGPDALALPWSVENLNHGTHFFQAIGLMNEAHRWAYEDMVTFGYRPENLKVLARTSLIGGDRRMVKKYTNILKQTVFYRKWAENLEEMVDHPDRIRSDPRMAAKVAMLPRSEFFVEYQYPPNVLVNLLEAQPDHKRALEYLLAGFLLGRNPEAVMGSIQGLVDAGYTRIPRYVEEVVLMLLGDSGGDFTLAGMPISEETRARFEAFRTFVAGAGRNPSAMRERMQERFGDTYWYYYQFR